MGGHADLPMSPGHPFYTRLNALLDAHGFGGSLPDTGGPRAVGSEAEEEMSNTDWTNPHDPDAKVMKMKNGRIHLAHKAEHAVDVETGAIVAVTMQGPLLRGGARSGTTRLVGGLRGPRGPARTAFDASTRRDDRALRGHTNILRRLRSMSLCAVGVR